MNKTKRQKGNEFQLWIKDWLERKGWIVRNFPAMTTMLEIKGRKIFRKINLDVFGCDLIARKGNRCLWIQATLDSSVSKRQAEFDKYLINFNMLSGEDFLIWMKNEKGEINIKLAYMQANYEKGLHSNIVDVGKIIRRKFYLCEGISYEF